MIWWIWFLISEQLLDKADSFTAPATLNLIPLNGKQGTLQNVADIYGGRPFSARGRKSRNKEEEVCLPHVCHFARHTNSTILTLTVPSFPAWFHLCNKIKGLHKFLGNTLPYEVLEFRCVCVGVFWRFSVFLIHQVVCISLSQKVYWMCIHTDMTWYILTLLW